MPELSKQYSDILRLHGLLDEMWIVRRGALQVKSAYSEQLFGEKFVEVDRTLMTLQCLRWNPVMGQSNPIQLPKAQPALRTLGENSSS